MYRMASTSDVETIVDGCCTKWGWKEDTGFWQVSLNDWEGGTLGAVAEVYTLGQQ